MTMKPWVEYKNKLRYPRMADYSTVYVYKDGELKRTFAGTDRLSRSQSLALEEGLGGPFVMERVLGREEEASFLEAMKNYRKEDNRLWQMFKDDLFEEFDVADNPKRELCFAKAQDRGSGTGHEGIFEAFEELVELIVP